MRSYEISATAMHTVAIMEDSTYKFGLYAAFSCPSSNDELVVIVLASI